MKPLIVGEAPSKDGDQLVPIGGRIGMRLACCAGIAPRQFFDAFDRMNLLNYRQEVAGKGFCFDAGAGRQIASVIRQELGQGQIVILLGKRVAAAFGIRPEYFVEQSVGPATAYVVPHPSGVNRWWNDAENYYVLMCRFMRSIVMEMQS